MRGLEQRDVLRHFGRDEGPGLGARLDHRLEQRCVEALDDLALVQRSAHQGARYADVLAEMHRFIAVVTCEE